MALASAAGSIRMASPYQPGSRVGSRGVYADSVVAQMGYYVSRPPDDLIDWLEQQAAMLHPQRQQ
jgi:hypothetical protein